MFSDLNKNVVQISKSLDIMYDKRNKPSAETLALLDKVAVFKELTEKSEMSLRSKSPKLFTLAALYDASGELLKGRGNEDVVEMRNCSGGTGPRWPSTCRIGRQY